TEQTSEGTSKLAPGVEGHTTVPAAPTDRGLAEFAPHRRLGNVPEEPLQDLNPDSGIHENVKKGTELTLEETGLGEEAEEGGGEQRGGRVAPDAPPVRGSGPPARRSATPTPHGRSWGISLFSRHSACCFRATGRQAPAVDGVRAVPLPLRPDQPTFGS